MTTMKESPAEFLARALQAVPNDPRKFSSGPVAVEVEPLHLSVTQTWESGTSHNTHVVENGDIGVILRRGASGKIVTGCSGTLVVSLDVDDDHDEIHYTGGENHHPTDEVLAQAIEALVAARWALKHAGRASA